MARTGWLSAALCLGVLSSGAGYAQSVAAGVAATTPATTAGTPSSTVGKTSAAPSAPVRKSCVVDKNPPDPAASALNRKDYKAAESLFRVLLKANPTSSVAHEGLIRSLLEQDNLTDAARDSEAWNAAMPADSWTLTALAEVRLRQGVPAEAYGLFQRAIHADLCNARAYYGLAEVEGLAGYFAAGKRLIEQAYVLHPTDDDINTAWIATRPRTERLVMWNQYADHSDQINDEDRTKLKTRLAKDSLYHASDCRMATDSPREAKVPMAALMDGPNRFIGWGLDVKFNGKNRRLQIDTGASGITISRAAALFLGIQREDATQVGGIGDGAKVKTSVTHVASIKIGGIEFTNCPVEILEKWSVLDDDGLIGGDVFSDSLLTLDFPKHELRIAPLPLRPGEKPADAAKPVIVGDDEEFQAHDPYIAPGMEKWLRVYRNGHELLMPTGLADTKRIKDPSAWKDKLFLLDTGSDLNLISPSAAREVTKVSRDESTGIRGIQGEMNKVYEAGKFTLEFANLRLDSPSMTSIDTTSISHDSGVEVAGLIGAQALFQVVMHIDYRDNLVWCEYTPPK
jgi:predicted aspartyl protease